MVSEGRCPPDVLGVKTTAVAGLAVVLLSGCTGSEAPPSPGAAATASCAALGDLFARGALRMTDVHRLGTAQGVAEAAAEGEPRWSGLATAITRLHAAAAQVAESVERPTSGSEQRAINAEFTSAKGEAERACARV